MPEKIGEDVIGKDSGYYLPPLTEEEKEKLRKKVKEELKKKQAKKKEKLPEEEIPGEHPHEPTPEERALTKEETEKMKKLMKGKVKDVHVKEHFRSKPKKKKQKESFFDFP